MDTTDFLRQILPDQGHYCLARPVQLDSGRTVFKHVVHPTIDTLAATALAWDKQGHDVYYAVASLKEKKIFDPRKGEKGGYRVRTKPNIHSLHCVFLEVDVLRPDDVDSATEAELARKYTSRKEAIDAIKAFCHAIDWPLPALVSSGWGYHLYWPLQEAVEPNEYATLVKRMKLAAKKQHFKLDPAATDISRVLRVPNTHNHKEPDNPQPVVVLKQAKSVHTYDALSQLLDEFLAQHNISIDTITKKFDIPPYLQFKAKTNTTEYDDDDPLDLDRIIVKCGAMKEFVDSGGAVPYQFWMHGLQLVRFCKGGRDLAHELSSPAASYDEAATDKLLDSLEEKDIPPPLCASFNEVSDACKTCVYWQKIRTPAVLGRDTPAPRQATQAAAAAAAAGHTPPPPWPYKHETGKGVFVEVVDKEGVKSHEPVFNYDMLPVKRLYSEREQREVTLWRTSNPADGVLELEVPSAALYEKRQFQSVLADSGVYCDLYRIDKLRDYMISYVQEIQRVFPKEMMYARMGWRGNFTQFVYAGELYEAAQIRSCEVERQGRVVDAVATTGTREGWQAIMDHFSHDDFVGHQFGLGTAFGSILMPFTGISGGIINMVGQSGEGKTTVQKVVNSVWGHPTALMLPAETKSSTYNAKVSFINQMNNLPICAEEITNAPADEVGSLAYAITQGSEKWRADIKGNVRESAGGWCTTMLASSNTSMHEKLHDSEGAGAKALRVLEYRLVHVNVFTKAEFRQGVDMPLTEHYGHAGRIYVAHVVANLADIKDQVKQKMLEVDTLFDMAPEERVWSAVIATNIVGLEVAKKLGLHKFNTSRIEGFVRDLLGVMRGSVADIVSGPLERIAQFFNESISQTLVVETDRHDVVYVVHRPYHSVSVRYDLGTGELYVTISALRKWCADHGESYTQLIDGLSNASIIDRTPHRQTLGKGADIPSSQARVISFKTTAPAFAQALKTISSIKPNTTEAN